MKKLLNAFLLLLLCVSLSNKIFTGGLAEPDITTGETVESCKAKISSECKNLLGISDTDTEEETEEDIEEDVDIEPTEGPTPML